MFILSTNSGLAWRVSVTLFMKTVIKPLSHAASAWVVLATVAGTAWGYDSRLHQDLTFIAAKELSLCQSRDDEVSQGRLTALDTRYIVRANVAEAASNLFTRMFRWNYYAPGDEPPKAAWGLIDTRFKNHVEQLIDSLRNNEQREERLKTFGRLLTYIQDVTSPAHVVPVFTTRWWRLSFYDRFDRYKIDANRLADDDHDYCGRVQAVIAAQAKATDAGAVAGLLSATAELTMRAVRAPIDGFPARWSAYWQFAEREGDFGEYGPAGNTFGERTRFRCGEGTQCLLLRNDPLYRDFAHSRHRDAVAATMEAMILLQNMALKQSIALKPNGPPTEARSALRPQGVRLKQGDAASATPAADQ